MAEGITPGIAQAATDGNFKNFVEIPTYFAGQIYQNFALFDRQMTQLAYANSQVGLERMYAVNAEEARAITRVLSDNELARVRSELGNA